MSAKSDPRIAPAGSEYFYRRSLSVSELLPAIGAGVATGLLAFYVARVLIERTPLVAPDQAITTRRSRHRRSPEGRARGG
jgi:hypothetical protein